MKTNMLADRHIGIKENDVSNMLEAIGIKSLDNLINKVIPADIRLKTPLNLPPAISEAEYLEHINKLAEKNKLFTSYIGTGWYDTITPSVIQRNVFENPTWYTSYSPYQAEISQGRLEALFNFQTVISDLTEMEISNASLLDESTAANEAAVMMLNINKESYKDSKSNTLFIDKNIFPQIINSLESYASQHNIKILKGRYDEFSFSENNIFGCIIQYPNSSGNINDYREFIEKAHSHNCMVAVDVDILSLALLIPPGEWGADIVFGNTQRLGIPMFLGGPAAAYIATRTAFKDFIPGIIIYKSKDKYNHNCFNIFSSTTKKDKKYNSLIENNCVAQSLLAIMAGFYAIFHGQDGIKFIAKRINSIATLLNRAIIKLGYKEANATFFDTLRFELPENVSPQKMRTIALGKSINLKYYNNGDIGFSIDETTTLQHANIILWIFSIAAEIPFTEIKEIQDLSSIKKEFRRKKSFLTENVFTKYNSETEIMRYIKRLERKDISLTQSMIPLGSCTMKGNPASAMIPLDNIKWTKIHPLVPIDQAEGYFELIKELGEQLKVITGFEGISFQTGNTYSGASIALGTIKGYLKSKKQNINTNRDIILIPSSSHSINYQTAIECGFHPIICKCYDDGYVDTDYLREKAEENKDRLAALMITYPSIFGLFETNIREICKIVHKYGGQVYMDGINMNAQVGITNPATIGADICHLNLHKTFTFPHGASIPEVGPICVSKHLIPFLPGNFIFGDETNQISPAPYSNSGFLPISYGYICMMGGEGLKRATQTAILSANYMAVKLKENYDIINFSKYKIVGHEIIIDCDNFTQETGITENDIAKRLMDYGYHAPTLSFPRHNTLLIEPTESESLWELNNFISVMNNIKKEIDEIKEGATDNNDNVLKNAPHPDYEAVSNNWEHSYTREKAVYPISWVRENKFWINVARIKN